MLNSEQEEYENEYMYKWSNPELPLSYKYAWT